MLNAQFFSQIHEHIRRWCVDDLRSTTTLFYLSQYQVSTCLSTKKWNCIVITSLILILIVKYTHTLIDIKKKFALNMHVWTWTIRYDMELHMVHSSTDPNMKNQIAVVGVLYKIGHPDPFLSKVIIFISFYFLFFIQNNKFMTQCFTYHSTFFIRIINYTSHHSKDGHKTTI